MYRQTLADILAEDFVAKRGWSEEKAVELGYQVLRGNVEQIFPSLGKPASQTAAPTQSPAAEPGRPETQLWSEPQSALGIAGAAGVVAGIANAADEMLDEPPTIASSLDEMLSETIALGSDLNDEMETDFLVETDEEPVIELSPDDSASAESTVDFSEPDVAMQPNPVTGELTWNVDQEGFDAGDVDPNAQTYEIESSDESDAPRFVAPVPDDLLETLDLDAPMFDSDGPASDEPDSNGPSMEDTIDSDPFEDDLLTLESDAPPSESSLSELFETLEFDSGNTESDINQTIGIEAEVAETVEFDSFDDPFDEFETTGDSDPSRPDVN